MLHTQQLHFCILLMVINDQLLSFTKLHIIYNLFTLNDKEEQQGWACVWYETVTTISQHNTFFCLTLNVRVRERHNSLMCRHSFIPNFFVIFHIFKTHRNKNNEKKRGRKIGEDATINLWLLSSFFNYFFC